MDDRYHLVVVGGTPAGIMTAVRSAREGLATLLVSYRKHLGGIMSSGLGGLDTLFDRPRAPLYDEVLDRIRAHYATAYGKDSPQYQACDRKRPGRFRYESRVVEAVFDEMLAAEPHLEVMREFEAVAVERAERRLDAVLVRPNRGGDRIRLSAGTFVDATYEGDLAALAGVPYVVGRESRGEFGEPHAGRIFTVRSPGRHPRDAAAGTLNLIAYPGTTREIFAGTTGEGDQAVQSYNYRLCLTNVPENRRLPEPPGNYDRSRYLGVVESDAETVGKPYTLQSQLVLNDVRDLALDPARWSGQLTPNSKFSYNEGNMPGQVDAYPRASWPEREEIERRHLDHALGLLYFLQNDEAVPDEIRSGAREWGLARDEFTDNDNLPYEMYVREARRIRGRTVFTEHDACPAPGIERPPVQADAVAIAEWPMDSHECTTDRHLGSLYEGEFLLVEKTRPSQIPFSVMLADDLDNLLVVTCVSASHVGWGTIRVEPTWMHLGEACGYAVARADALGVPVGRLPVERLQRVLAANRVLLGFFNDVDAGTEAPWYEAVQYFCTKGFFPGYDADADLPVAASTARLWVRAVGDLHEGRHDAMALARALTRCGAGDDGDTVTVAEFVDLVAEEWRYRRLDGAAAVGAVRAAWPADGPLSRGEACHLLLAVVDTALDRPAQPAD